MQTIVNDGTYLGLLGDGDLATTYTDWNNLIIQYVPPTNVMPSTVIGSAITQGSGSILNITTSFNESAIPLANIQSFSLFCNMSSNATISTLNTVNESLYNFNVQQSQMVTNILPTTSTFVNIATSAQAYFNTWSWLNCTFKWFNITGINLMMNFTIQLEIWYLSVFAPIYSTTVNQQIQFTMSNNRQFPEGCGWYVKFNYQLNSVIYNTGYIPVSQTTDLICDAGSTITYSLYDNIGKILDLNYITASNQYDVINEPNVMLFTFYNLCENFSTFFLKDGTFYSPTYEIAPKSFIQIPLYDMDSYSAYTINGDNSSELTVSFTLSGDYGIVIQTNNTLANIYSMISSEMLRFLHSIILLH